MVTIRLDGMLKEFGAPRSVRTEGASVREMLDSLEARYPRLQFRIRDEAGRRRGNVRLFVNGVDIDELDGLNTSLDSRDEVEILHSIQGG